MSSLDTGSIGASAVRAGLVTVEQLVRFASEAAAAGDGSGEALVARMREAGAISEQQAASLLEPPPGPAVAEPVVPPPDDAPRGDSPSPARRTARPDQITRPFLRRGPAVHEHVTIIPPPGDEAPQESPPRPVLRATSRARRILEETRVAHARPQKTSGSREKTQPPTPIDERADAVDGESRAALRRTPISLLTLPGEQRLDGAEQRRDGKYRIGHEVGRGGMGLVRVAEDLELGRRVALKTLLAGPDADERLIRALVNEARTTGQLEHPNIIPVHELGVLTTGEVYYTMKLMGRQSLRDVITALVDGDPGTTAEFTQVRALGIVQQLCMALHYAHSRGVIHRDVKPENVLIGSFGEVHLMDWGIAKVQGHKTPLEGTSFASDGFVAGTPTYMAPEQARGDYTTVDHRADIYSVGVILYELLTLTVPVEAPERAEDLAAAKERPIVPPSLRNPERRVPAALDAICSRALGFHPAARYPDARALWRDIEAFLEGSKERERLRHRSADEVRLGEASATLYHGLMGQQERLVAQIDRAERQATPWDPELERRRLWRHKNRVSLLELAIGRAFAEAVKYFNRAIGYDPDCEAARRGLSALYESRSLAAGRKHDFATMIYFGDLQRELYPDSRAQGRLTVRSYPTGARVHLVRAEALDGDIELDAGSLAGTAPVHDIPLEPGGYMLVATLDGYRETFMPVVVRGGESSALLLRLHPSSADVPLVGKEEELGRLRVMLRTVVERRTLRSVLVSGTLGIGKSRLLGAFDDYVQDLPDVFLYVQTECRRLYRWVPFSAFADLLRYRAGLAPGDPPELLRERVQDMVAYAMAGLAGRDGLDAAETDRMRALADQVLQMPGLGAELEPPRDRRDEAAVQCRSIFDAVLELFEMLVRQRPIILYIHDMHHMDRTSRTLLEELAGRLAGSPMLLVATSDPSEVGAEHLEAFPFHERVRLQGLRREGVAQFLREILHGPVSDDLVYRVHRHTSGSPLAVEATVRMLIEERRLEQRGGDFCLVPSAAPLLQGAFDLRAEAERRLSGLGEAEGRAVRAAAVIGEAFWPGALRALGVPNPKEAVASLLKAEIVTRQPMSRFSGYEELTFKQVAVRDAIYGGLPEDERKRLHGLMVPWLEARAERGIVWMAAVAEHLVGAGRLSEAAAHHAEMAKAARAIASWHDAAMHYRRAAELVEDGRRRSEWLAQMTEMLAKIGGDTVRAGDFKVVPRVVPEGL